MNSGGDTSGLGLDAWARQFREFLASFGPVAGLAGKPDWSTWANPGTWFGSGAGGGFPGTGSAMPNPFSQMSDSGPFSNLFEQLSTLAQGQWQQLAARATNAGTDFQDWQESLATLWPGNAASFPGMDTSGLRAALSTPQVGPMREHIERWQQAMLAQLDLQEASRVFSGQMNTIMQRALTLFREQLASTTGSDSQPTSMRELFDAWIEAGEQAWAEHASSDAFIAALGQFSNAQMRVRAARFDQINRLAQSLGLPTRTEVDADHRRIAQLERELRRMRKELEARPVTTTTATQPAATRAVESATKPARSGARAAAKKTTAKTAKPAANTATSAAPARARTATTVKSPAKSAPTKAPAKSRARKAQTFPVVAAPQAIGKTARKSTGKTAATRTRTTK